MLLLRIRRAGGDQAEQPNLEFITPSKVYAVVGGVTTVLDIMQLPALTPRQISLLAKHGPNGEYAGER
jgi:3-deoxy-D-manno-octulosonic acid (KDO) 8-phosphate synthase